MIQADGDFDESGITERELNKAIEERYPENWYVWRTVGDEKVRGAHAAREGRRFQWNNPPDGGHPTEDYNCRCWAENVSGFQLAMVDPDDPLGPLGGDTRGPLPPGGGAGGRRKPPRRGQKAKDEHYYRAPKNLKAFPDAKRAKPKGGRERWKDSKGKIYEWDYRHGEVEIYDKTGKQHLGAYDPLTGRQLKGPDNTKKVDK